MIISVSTLKKKRELYCNANQGPLVQAVISLTMSLIKI